MNNQKYTNKIVVVTGSSQGIGKNIAQRFAEAEAHVVIVGIDAQMGKETVTNFSKKGLTANQIVCDLSKSGAGIQLIKDVVSKFGRIDVLVNNAKSGKRRTLFEESEITWETGMAVTLKAAFFCAQEAIRQMSKTGGGSIVNISSVVAQVVGHDAPVYHIAKAGMVQMTRYLAVYGAQYGVRVNCVQPGFIVKDEHQERFTRKSNHIFRTIANFIQPLGRTGTSDDVAKAVLFLASDEASFMTGQSLVVDGGLLLQDQSNIVYRFAQKTFTKHAV